MARLTKSKYLSGSEHVHGLGRCSDIIKRLWIIRHRHWREGRVPDEDEDGLKLWKLSEKALVKHSYCLTKVNSSVSKIALISIGLRRWCCFFVQYGFMVEWFNPYKCGLDEVSDTSRKEDHSGFSQSQWMRSFISGAYRKGWTLEPLVLGIWGFYLLCNYLWVSQSDCSCRISI